MSAQFNPFTVKISHHAKKRYLERHENKASHLINKNDLSSVERKMRDTLFMVYTQTPLSKGTHDRKHFKYEDDVFVLSKNFDIVVTYYKYENLSKTKVKQIRKTLPV
jgi:hypothetical protein